MAYRTHSDTNDGLVDGLKDNDVLHSEVVEKAMRQVDRADFSVEKSLAYVDRPQPTSQGQTISAPHMHVVAMEILEPMLKEGARILDVGSGSGYLCACFSKMMGDKGTVIGIDIHEPLVEWSINNLKKHHQDLLDSRAVTIKQGNGWQGDEKSAPFDAINVGAAASEIPMELVKQLAPGGRMIIPVGGPHGQDMLQIDKDENQKVTQKSLMGVIYVPLVKSL